jgi:hypothetical protein
MGHGRMAKNRNMRAQPKKILLNFTNSQAGNQENQRGETLGVTRLKKKKDEANQTAEQD